MNLRRRQAGQSLVESALILTALMGLLVGMADVGQLLFVRETLADRTRIAARWGALNSYQPEVIRRVVLYGTPAPEQGQTAFFGLTPASVEVSNPGCPGAGCRVIVAIPSHGIRSFDLVEDSNSPTSTLAGAPPASAAAPSKP